MRRLIDALAGGPSWGRAGIRRGLSGLRQGNTRDVQLGLALAVLAYIRRSEPGRQLIYRARVPEGSAIVIHHRRSGDPRVEVIKPKK